MRILHLLSQRPSLTGSGITLDALVRHAGVAGFKQCVVVGVPADDPTAPIGELTSECVHPLRFGLPPLNFPVPGMSDVMPYPSTRFSDLDEEQVSAYRRAWAEHLRPILDDFRPDLIHSHHVWLMSALLKDVAPEIPVVTHCHATGLRQIKLCPHLADDVRAGCSRNDAFIVLHACHAMQLQVGLGIDPARIHVVGAGYREDLFHCRGRHSKRKPALLYIGKYSAAKGVPWLLDAFERVLARDPAIRLHVAGGGAGEEADALRSRMDRMAPAVVQHGQLAQPELADLTRNCTVCVLPSFYEGLPLVLVEALACGCRLVATDLPGIMEELAPRLGDALATVELPRLETVDRPRPDDLPAFVDRLEETLESALNAPALGDPMDSMPEALTHFTWARVFNRVEEIWRRLVARSARGPSRSAGP
jgi:glycosyltransferase involved in cell wall biosynthesis